MNTSVQNEKIQLVLILGAAVRGTIIDKIKTSAFYKT